LSRRRNQLRKEENSHPDTLRNRLVTVAAIIIREVQFNLLFLLKVKVDVNSSLEVGIQVVINGLCSSNPEPVVLAFSFLKYRAIRIGLAEGVQVLEVAGRDVELDRH
jgi:hypothetical protein